MSINFNRIYPLLFLIPAGLILFFTYKRFLGKQFFKSTLFRGLTAILLVLSLCGVHISQTAEETTTIFLADLSHSTADSKEDMEQFIKEAISVKGDKDLLGVLSFGADSKVEQVPSLIPMFSDFETKVDGEFTNIQTGLISANALIPNGTKRRIVLMTDGYENIGDGRKQISGIVTGDTAIDVVDYSLHEFGEIQYESLIVPEKVEKNQTIEVQSRIFSNIDTRGTLFVYSNNQIKFEKEVSIESGENLYVFTDTITDSGLVTYSGQVIVDKDTYIENNHVSSYTFVNDLPKLLIIQGEDEQALNLIGMLEKSAIVNVVNPEEVPTTIEELIKYDGYILSNVSIENLAQEFLEHMEEAIRLQGKGLLVTGGETSYGPGGYYKTLLEDMLPVNMDAKPKEEKPNLALMLVIDRSGSMSSGEYGVSKMELAKEAAIRSLDVLEDKDFIGVLGFDTVARWVVEPVKATNKEKIETQIASMGPGGGTSIQPSLEKAIDSLEEIDAGLKHIILLTDGQAESTGYLPLLERMESLGMTLSTVAVGSGADKNLLKLLAEYGNGRYYATDVFTDIPSIFTKEAFMAGKKYLNNVTFFPRVTADSSIISGISGLPELEGYVAVTAKDTGKVILSGPDDDPILATWQYGVGRSVAYMSDMKGLWSRNWLAWDGNQNFWMNTISWLVQQDINSDYVVNGYYEKGKGIIDVNSLIKGDDYASLEGLLSTPSGKTTTITLEATAPGEYRGEFDPEGEGVYLVSLKLGQGEKAEQFVSAVNIGYSNEYDFFSHDKITMNEMINLSEGRLLTKASDVFKSELPDVKGSRDLSMLFMILAFISFMIEIILRKFKPPVRIVSDQVSKVSTSIRKRFEVKDKTTSTKAVDHVNQLLKGKRKR